MFYLRYATDDGMLSNTAIALEGNTKAKAEKNAKEWLAKNAVEALKTKRYRVEVL